MRPTQIEFLLKSIKGVTQSIHYLAAMILALNMSEQPDILHDQIFGILTSALLIWGIWHAYGITLIEY